MRSFAESVRIVLGVRFTDGNGGIMGTVAVDIDRHVFAAAEALAKKEGRPAGQVVSDLLREALDVRMKQAASETPRELYGFRPLPPRGVVVTDDFVNELRDELGV